MYTDTFKNTFALDVLEYLSIVKIPEVNPNDTQSDNDSSSSNLRKNDIDLEVATQDSAQDSIDSNLNKEEAIVEEKDPFLVDWNGDNDPDNPQNWSTSKKTFMVIQVMLLTSVTYMGSSIYTPGQEALQKEFHVGHVAATLNLSIYVLGYGLGPIMLSPFSEFALLGRQHIYIITLFCFCMFQIGAATVHNLGGMIVIRFFSGIFCSPALTTGGATISDIINPQMVPVVIGLWSVAAVAAPALGPLIGAAMQVAEGWRWIFWLLLWMCAATLILLIIFFPETHHGNILYRRTNRLKKMTGDDRYYSKQAKKESELDLKSFTLTALYRPIKIIVKEPVVLAFDCYLALCYGIFYLFFEAFPIVFVGIYHFSMIELGLSFLGFQVGCAIAYSIFLFFLMKYLVPKFKNNTFQPEDFLVLSMSVCWALPLALFFFGWTVSVHWILPIISEIFFVINVFNLFQVTFAYLAMVYPDHVASVYAGNGLCRSVFACAFPLFGQAMFNNLGTKNYPVAWGASLLGFVAIGMAFIPFIIYRYGATLRSKSKYTD